MTIRDYINREPEPRARHVLTAVSGVVLVSLGLLYAGLPRVLQVSLFSVGALNLLTGAAEFLPRNRARWAGVMRVIAYAAFAVGATAAVILAVFSDG